MSNQKLRLAAFPLLLAATGVAYPLRAQTGGESAAQTYDIVIANGRVMDPESGRDEVANVGINGRSIATISTAKLKGRRTIDAANLVVAPGFVDLHAHGQNPKGEYYQVLDGVTTAIDAEGGAMPIAPFLAALSGKALVNFGATASHQCARREVISNAPCSGHGAIDRNDIVPAHMGDTDIAGGQLADGTAKPAQALVRAQFLTGLRQQLHTDADAKKGGGTLEHTLVERFDHAGNCAKPRGTGAECADTGQDDAIDQREVRDVARVDIEIDPKRDRSVAPLHIVARPAPQRRPCTVLAGRRDRRAIGIDLAAYRQFLRKLQPRAADHGGEAVHLSRS